MKRLELSVADTADFIRYHCASPFFLPARLDTRRLAVTGAGLPPARIYDIAQPQPTQPFDEYLRVHGYNSNSSLVPILQPIMANFSAHPIFLEHLN